MSEKCLLTITGCRKNLEATPPGLPLSGEETKRFLETSVRSEIKLPPLIRTFCSVMLLLALLSPTLHAHNVVAGAYIDGMTIEGEIGFSNGEPALPNVLVEILDDAGNKVGETHIEDGGLFTFTATTAQKHILKANLGSGHIAEITVEADEFTAEPSAATTPKTASLVAQNTAQNPTESTVITGVTGISVAKLESIVRKAVAQQVKPLQKELRAYKEKVMFRDITGGLGFIFGLFGVAAWMASRNPTKKPSKQSSKPEQG